MIISSLHIFLEFSVILSPVTQRDTIVLFNGNSLDGWEVVDYSGHGNVTVEGQSLILEKGYSITAVKYNKEIPQSNYEVNLLARRLEGSDFFCGLTFPVKGSFNTLVIGGWGGSITGLSCIDDEDAANNITYNNIHFDNNRWYSIRLRVTEEKIEAWISNYKIVDFEIADHSLSLRWEVESCKPFGIATWRTTGEIRDIYVVNNIE